MLSFKERKGLVVYVAISGLSLTSVLLLLGVRLARKRTIPAIGLFFLLLLFWELLQAIAGFMSLRWVLIGDVISGNFCIAQAILNLLSATGTALATIGLSWCILHDYVFKAGTLGLKHAFCILAAMSALQMLVVLAPGLKVGAKELFKPSGFWCWLPLDRYYALKTLTTYLFYWMAVAVSLFSAFAYWASEHVGKPLPSGYCWIGFPTKQNGLLRMGVFSKLDTLGRVPKFGFTLDVLWFESNISIFFMQYLRPPPEPLVPDIPMSSMSGVESELATPPLAETEIPTSPMSGEIPTSPISGVESESATPPLAETEIPTSPMSGIEPRSAPPPLVKPNQTRPIRDALKLLIFPLAYAFFVIPLSVVRYITFEGHTVGSAGIIFVGSWFALTGFMEVLLFVWLKPNFGL